MVWCLRLTQNIAEAVENVQRSTWAFGEMSVATETRVSQGLLSNMSKSSRCNCCLHVQCWTCSTQHSLAIAAKPLLHQRGTNRVEHCDQKQIRSEAETIHEWTAMAAVGVAHLNGGNEDKTGNNEEGM